MSIILIYFHSMPTPTSLLINCGYARVDIRELSPPERIKHRKEVACEERRQGFLSLFSSATHNIPDEYQLSYSEHLFRGCNKILDYFSNKWHPQSKRLVYLSTFSTKNWKRLTNSEKEKHMFSRQTSIFPTRAHDIITRHSMHYQS